MIVVFSSRSFMWYTEDWKLGCPQITWILYSNLSINLLPQLHWRIHYSSLPLFFSIFIFFAVVKSTVDQRLHWPDCTRFTLKWSSNPTIFVFESFEYKKNIMNSSEFRYILQNKKEIMNFNWKNITVLVVLN